MLTPGQDAPDFELRSHKGGTVRLSDFRGKQNVVLAFHPLAFTPVCANQMRGYESDLVRAGWRGGPRDQHRCPARESRVGQVTRLDFLRSPQRLSSPRRGCEAVRGIQGKGRLLRAGDFRHRQVRQIRLVEGVRDTRAAEESGSARGTESALVAPDDLVRAERSERRRASGVKRASRGAGDPDES